MPDHDPPPPAISRRDLLGGTAAGVGLLALGGTARADRRAEREWPAIVIGSGYGGSVAALHLTRAGVRTLVLEMGADWPQRTRPFHPIAQPGRSSLWLQRTTILPFGPVAPAPFYSTGVLDLLRHPAMDVYVGRGVGGGSLVNGGICIEPRLQDFPHVLPTVEPRPMYRTYFPRARRRLRVNSMDRRFFRSTPWYQFARTAVSQARRAGLATTGMDNVYDFDFMYQEARPGHPRSAFNGEAILGNNYGKRSLDTTYLRMAGRTGRLTIKPLHRVRAIHRTRKGTYRIDVERIDSQGRTVTAFTLRTPRLFLGGGSMGTTELLLRSAAEGGLDIPDAVGRGWGNNGNVMTGRVITRDTGVEQSTIPVRGVDLRSDRHDPLLAEIAPMPVGVETRTSLYLGVTRNPHRARMVWDARAGRVRLGWRKQFAEPSSAAMLSLMDRLNDANGGSVARNLFPEGTGSDFTYHPLGGCNLGSATDNHGRLRGNPGLYVVDGSLIPGDATVNPFLTITALAERNMDHIVDRDLR